MNWTWLLVRSAIGVGILGLLFLSQRFWYRAIWRITSNWGSQWLRVSARLLYVILLLLFIGETADSFRMGQRGYLVPTGNLVTVLAGLWFFSALFAYLAMKSVRGIDRIWAWLRAAYLLKTAPQVAVASASSAAPAKALPADSAPAAVELIPNPSRRYFFKTATALAGAGPFLTAMYGFAAERLDYQVRRIEIPVANLPAGLEGMKIVQISDIHLSSFMPRLQVRRAVEMANDLGADIAITTGDFITGPSDPIADCIDEVRRLRAPLGVWGCNGNHEIYARAEAKAQTLFAQAGMKLLRQQNAQVTFNGASFNLIGVDYQRERTPGGRRLQMLQNGERFVRRDMPNILLSHNPNSFNRAAELGIELSLAGHTHGGQIQVEILDHRLSPARFITDYIAGLYQRPMFAPAPTDRSSSGVSRFDKNRNSLLPSRSSTLAAIYVNRGLGTVGAPVRLGVPPEISLITLRRA
ncbi:MAG TPA: metallophosphoesterase [Candidatus Solibacter sp.]|nr:metallophosphoesterase [Candidatus Solibacter sp.]